MAGIPNLKKLDALENIFLLGFRALVGAFLIWGVWDNIVDAARMAEFATFLKAHGFPYPKVMAPLSVGVQLACGVGFLTGILIRWAGLFCALNFIVAIMMVDGPAGIRPSFPSAMLVAFGLYIAARGAGSFSLSRG